jgi:hypothetical protein
VRTAITTNNQEVVGGGKSRKRRGREKKMRGNTQTGDAKEMTKD